MTMTDLISHVAYRRWRSEADPEYANDEDDGHGFK
jgi:hypothetical protein